jgi:peptide-methionine (R)-S-oxide reductase
MKKKVVKTDEEWRQQLTPEQYRVARMKGTERPFTGEYNNSGERGMYQCAACGNELFSSEAKFDSGCGWPSFTEPTAEDNVRTEIDRSHGMTRVEVMCASCEAHLGHVFDDGPKPTNQRYCINSVVLKLAKEEE